MNDLTKKTGHGAWGVKIKNTVRYHLTPVRTARVKKTEKQALVRTCRDQSPCALLLGA